MFYNLAHRSVFLDKIIVFFAQIFPYLVILLAVTFLFFHHEIFSAKEPFKAFQQKWREIVIVFFSGCLAWVLAYVLKFFFHTARPFVMFQNVQNLLPESGFSFPSGHATFYMALAFAIFFSHKKAGYWFMFFALLIGLARIAAGVHFPIDILGGFFLGILTAYLVRFLYNKVILSQN
jgi:undecaprenyl-diphosphatase